MKNTFIKYIDLITCINKYNQNQNIYLILDAAQISEEILLFINELRKDVRIEFYSLFAGTTEGNVPFEVAPLLIVINDLRIFEDNAFNFIHEIWHLEQVLNIVISKLPLADFAKKMKRYLTVEFPDGSKKLFRWYDPRIMKKISKILDNQQEHEFFKDIDKWIISVRNYQDTKSNQILVFWGTNVQN